MAEPIEIRFDGLGDDRPAGPTISATGALATLAGADAVRQSIMILLSTRPGERVMRPDYGCPLHRLVFMPNDETTAGLAIHYVRSAIVKFEPRVKILKLDVELDNPDTLSIQLDYRVRSTREADTLNVAIDMAGG